MRKKIKLSVQHVVGKQYNSNQPIVNKQVLLRGETFDDLYNLILQNRKISESTSCLNGYINSPKCTPQNTHRNMIDPIRVNRSVQKIQRSSIKIKQKSLSASKKVPKKISEKNIVDKSSNKISKFQRLFGEVIKKLNHSLHQHIREKQCFLNQGQLENVLQKMHYISKYNNNQKLIRKMWRQLGGCMYGGVSSQNLKQMLFIINNDNYLTKNNDSYLTKNNQRLNQPTKYRNEQIYIDENLKFKIKQSDKKYVYQEYQSIRANREDKSIYENRQNLQLMKTIKKTSENESENALRANQKNLQKQNQTQQKTNYSQSSHRQINVKKEYQQSFQNLYLKQKGVNVKTNDSKSELKPILSVDVNLGEGIIEKIIVYQGQSPSHVANRLAEKFHIELAMKLKFQKMLESHIRSLLWKIEEVSEELFSDRE